MLVLISGPGSKCSNQCQSHSQGRAYHLLSSKHASLCNDTCSPDFVHEFKDANYHTDVTWDTGLLHAPGGRTGTKQKSWRGKAQTVDMSCSIPVLPNKMDIAWNRCNLCRIWALPILEYTPGAREPRRGLHLWALLA